MCVGLIVNKYHQGRLYECRCFKTDCATLSESSCGGEAVVHSHPAPLMHYLCVCTQREKVYNFNVLKGAHYSSMTAGIM